MKTHSFPPHRRTARTVPEAQSFYASYEPLTTAPVTTGTPTVLTLDRLLAHRRPDPEWIVSQLLPIGVTVLAGKPQTGKTCLALNLALAVAGGDRALNGLDTARGEVLYLGLEDGARFMYIRAHRLLHGDTASTAFALASQWNTLERGGLADIEDWLAEHPRTRLVVLDTLDRVRPPTRHWHSPARAPEEFAILTPFRDMAATYQVAVVLLLHMPREHAYETRHEHQRARSLLYASDCALMLEHERGQEEATLYRSGHIVEEQEVRLHYNCSSARWSVGELHEIQGQELQRIVH